MALAPLSAGFQSLPPLPTIKLGPSAAASRVGGFVYILDPCGSLQWTLCEAGSFSHCCLNPTGVFNQRFEALCPPHWNSGLGGLSPSPPAAALPAMLHNPPPHWFCQPLPCQESSLPAAHLRPSYGSGWMFLLYLLGCRTSIQFDFLSVVVVFVFKSSLSFFWLCEAAQCLTYASILAGSPPNFDVF